MRIIFTLCLSITMILLTKMSYSECTEYKIIDHGDRVEAVCIGQPLNESEKQSVERDHAKKEKKIKSEKIDDRIDRISEQQYDLSLRNSEIQLKKQEVALEREKERLRREKLKNDSIEDRQDSISHKLDSLYTTDNTGKKKKKKNDL